MRINGPDEIYDPVEIPGWGQIHGHVIRDDITVARYEFSLNPIYGLRHLPALEDGIKTRRFGWRTEMAAELVLQIKRASALLGQLEPNREVTESPAETAGSFAVARYVSIPEGRYLPTSE